MTWWTLDCEIVYKNTSYCFRELQVLQLIEHEICVLKEINTSKTEVNADGSISLWCVYQKICV